MDIECEKLLLKAAARLDALQGRGKIKQNVGSIPNTMFSRMFCGRCFGCILHEALHVRHAKSNMERKPKRLAFKKGIRLLDELLWDGRHYKEKTAGARNYITRLETYLRNFCGAPNECFSHKEWSEGIKPGNVIRQALELNRHKPGKRALCSIPNTKL